MDRARSAIRTIKGLFVRSLFSISTTLAVWRVVMVKDTYVYWFILGLVVFLYIEAVVTFMQRESGEWKWFCPSVFFYLLSILPPLWILEDELLHERIRATRRQNLDLDHCVASGEIFQNVSSLVTNVGIEIPLDLEDHNWSLALQQTLIFLLILGRWWLPKGELTRDQLSQLLLVYIGIAADILEFVTEGLKIQEVRCNKILVYWILIIWSWSLLQFTLGLTVTKSRKPRISGVNQRYEGRVLMCNICETEVWGIVVTIIMQDGPFLSMRLYLLVHLRVINQMMIFFTFKNILVMLLQLYRLLVLYVEKPSGPTVLVQTVYKYKRQKNKSKGQEVATKGSLLTASEYNKLVATRSGNKDPKFTMSAAEMMEYGDSEFDDPFADSPSLRNTNVKKKNNKPPAPQATRNQRPPQREQRKDRTPNKDVNELYHSGKQDKQVKKEPIFYTKCETKDMQPHSSKDKQTLKSFKNIDKNKLKALAPKKKTFGDVATQVLNPAKKLNKHTEKAKSVEGAVEAKKVNHLIQIYEKKDSKENSPVRQTSLTLQPKYKKRELQPTRSKSLDSDESNKCHILTFNDL
ncbi:transmembrane protein 26-like isoform X2 [Antedon mediterranea]